MKELEKYGNQLTIVGMVLGNGNESEIIILPGEITPSPKIITIPDLELFKKIIKQLDTVEITGYKKAILRKTQRNIDQKISWNVFRRDNFKCRYCGTELVPMTVDHIVRWEMLGATVSDNLMCTCAKCNRTRGNTEYPEFLDSEYYKKVSVGITEDIKKKNIEAWAIAKVIPLRPRKRKR